MQITKLLFISVVFCSYTVSADVIKIYNWEEYLSEEMLSKFTEATGHTVEQFYYDDEDYRDSLLASGLGEDFDLVMVDNLSLKSDLQNSGFVSFPVEKIPSTKNISSQWIQSCGPKGIAYGWGTLGIAYRSSISSEPIDSWVQLFKPPKEHQGRVVMLKDSSDTINSALMASGRSPNSINPDDYKMAYQILNDQKEHVLLYGYGLSYAKDHGQESQMTMTIVYSGDTEQIMEETGFTDWEYVVPKEGTMLWVDCWTVPIKMNAYKPAVISFLNFINQPKNAAINADEVWVSLPINSAIKFTSADYQADPELHPNKDILMRSHTYEPLPNAILNLRDRILSEIIQKAP